VTGKADLAPTMAAAASLRVSGRSGLGLEALRAQVATALSKEDTSLAIAGFSERAEEALVRAALAMKQAVRALADSTLEVVAGETARASMALEEAVGQAADESVLDAVFRRFCIGK
jgi:tRNA modification GTPase